jgi:hypothetical protein
MPGDASSSEIQGRADSFRATLGAQQQAETILAEAAEMRRQAALQAELLVAEAESLARELTDRARLVADQTTSAARERADGILAQARESAEEVRRQAVAAAEAARGELLERLEAENRERLHGVRHRAEELLAGMETVVRGLGSTLQQAEGSVAEMEKSLHQVRSDAVERLPETPVGPSPSELAEAAAAAERAARTEALLVDLAERSVAPEPLPEPAPVPVTVTEPVEVVDAVEDDAARPAGSGLAPARLPEAPAHVGLDGDVQRPLGWLFRSTRP